MTFAPAPLKAARSYLLDKLDIHPGRDVDADLDPDEVGIVSSGYGDSYHRGKGYIGSGSYSAYFERDRRGLSGASSGLDIGEFDVTVNGRRLTLFGFNRWLVAQCEANAPDTRDIREVIYTLDGQTVKRWDRHKRRDSGDNSHLWHTHISYYRDSESHDKTALFRRYVEGTAGEDDDVQLNEKINLPKWAVDRWKSDPGIADGSILVGTGIWGGYIYGRMNSEKADAILKAVAGDSAEDIIAAIHAEGEKSREALASKLAELAPELAQAVADQVDHDLDTAAVEEALRTVLGAVDNPA